MHSCIEDFFQQPTDSKTHAIADYAGESNPDSSLLTYCRVQHFEKETFLVKVLNPQNLVNNQSYIMILMANTYSLFCVGEN